MHQSVKKDQKIQLENSKPWQLASIVVTQVRGAVQAVPYQEYYTLASPAIQAASSVTSDIAMAVGKGGTDAGLDYRYARGHLFVAKNVLLQAKQNGYAADLKAVIANIEKLHMLIEHELEALEQANEKQKEK